MGDTKTQIDEIYKLIMHLASGNLHYRASLSGESDELDAITVGINVLAEELNSTTVSRNYLDRVFKSVADMFFILQTDFTIIEVNEAVEKKLGFLQKSLMYKHFSELFVRKGMKLETLISKDVERTGSWSSNQRMLRTAKDGHQGLPVSITISPFYAADQTIGGWLVLAKDISEIKHTQDVLRAKNQELNTFIYRASHDLKGPLASILGLLNLAENDGDDPDMLRQYMQMIRTSAIRLDHILEDFLELGRLTQSKVKKTNIQFEELVHEIIDAQAYKERYNRLDLRLSVSQEQAFRSKKVLVKGILQNLIDNALKYTPESREKAEVNVKIVVNARAATIIVSDEGIGMDKKMLDKIFHMFYRGSDESKGMGLGLYVVRTSVDALNGRIHVKSQPGAGSTFTVLLPRSRKPSK